MKVLTVFGTRPEAIKMAPVVKALAADPGFDAKVCVTAQHRQMLDQVLDLFAIRPDFDLNLMKPGQDLSDITSNVLLGMRAVYQQWQPDIILVHGDTTTTLAASLSAYYAKVRVGHVEAGLRTGDLHNPFPEEMNRIVAGRLSRWHFAPTAGSRDNLLREGFDPSSVHVTGNTVIDALLQVVQRDTPLPVEVPEGRRMVLVTAHRRENFGAPFREVCLAIRELADRHGDVHFVYPVHPNPNVSVPAHEILSGHERITLCPPLDYLPFVAAMKRAHLVLTDSGGVQEEAPALAKPVLVMRRETERPEAVAAGVVRLVGPVRDAIVAEVSRLLDDPDAYAGMAKGVSPYGDGHAAARIADILKRDLVG